MRKIDKLILTSFIGPLILTFLVVIFILLTKQMFYYFDDIIGKDLGGFVIAKFLSYFAILMFPAALPLSILLASLITFGNLAEHFELNAIKASGISLVRVLQPIFFFVIFLTILAFYVNNYLVPRTGLEAYTLLYDIKKKKPALDIREGEFYTGLPDISIKVNKKFSQDDAALKDIILYDHRANNGNTEVILADSGRMTTIINERYLKLELFDGYQYTEGVDAKVSSMGGSSDNSAMLTKRTFLKAEMVTDLSALSFSTSDKKIFESNRQMRNIHQLSMDIDSLKKTIIHQRHSEKHYWLSHLERSIRNNSSYPLFSNSINRKLKQLYNERPDRKTIQRATDAARLVKSSLSETIAETEQLETELVLYEMQWHRISSNAIACIIMFLIGAPLGAIIKRGGLGVPFLISVGLFVLYTLLVMQGEKLAKHFFISAIAGAWSANALLLVAGLIFLKMARDDRHMF